MPLITAYFLQRRYLPQTIPSPPPLRHSERKRLPCLPSVALAKEGVQPKGRIYPLYATR